MALHAGHVALKRNTSLDDSELHEIPAFSHTRGRKDAAWTSIATHAEGADNPAALHRAGSSGENLRSKLKNELEEQQVKTFQRWWNAWLAEVGVKITDLFEDVKSGVNPIKLLEVLSDSSCGKYNKSPRITFQMLENHNIFLAQLKAKSIKLVNIGAEDLASGDHKLVLGLTWTLILRYEIHKFGANEAELYGWTNKVVESYGVNLEGGWTKGFSDGHAFCAIVHEAEPAAIDIEITRTMKPEGALQTAFDAAEKHLGVPQLLETSDFLGASPVDDKSVILYVAKLKQAVDEKVDERAAAEALAEAVAADESRAAIDAAAVAAQVAAESEAKSAAEAAARRAAIEEARKVIAAKVVTLETAATELTRWLTSTTNTFRTACEDDGTASLGDDEAATRALLATLRDAFRVSERPQRDADKVALTQLHVEIASLRSEAAAMYGKDAVPNADAIEVTDADAHVGAVTEDAPASGSDLPQGSAEKSNAPPPLTQAAASWIGSLFGMAETARNEDRSDGPAAGEAAGVNATKAVAAANQEDDGWGALHESTSPAFFEAAWAAMAASEAAYEVGLEARLAEHEAVQRAAATDAMASPLREEGAAILDWIATRTKSLQDSATPSALETMDVARVRATLHGLDAADSGDDVAAKEAQKASVQAGLREVATRIAAETPGGASWSPEPMVAELDEAWANMITAHTMLRRQLDERTTSLERAAEREQTNRLLTGADAKAGAWHLAVAAAAKDLHQKLTTIEQTAGAKGQGTALTGDSLVQVETEIETMRNAFAAKKAAWADEKAALAVEMASVQERLVAEGRDHPWTASLEAINEAWNDLGGVSAAYLETLLAAVGCMQAEEEMLKRKHEEEAARRAIDEALPAMVRRAEAVGAADEQAAAQAMAAEKALLPWVRSQRERLQKQLADLGDVRLGEMAADAPQDGPRAARRRSAVEHTTTKLAAQAQDLGDFVEAEMAPKKGELLQLRGDMHGAMATRQLQRFGGVRSSTPHRFNELLPSPPSVRFKVCVIEFVVPGAKNGGTDKGPNGHRIDSIPIANGVIKAGGACSVLRYDAAHHADFAERVSEYDGLVVRINPGQLSQGTPPGTQARFDALMNDQLAKGKLVWSSPDVQTKMGAKDALCKIAKMSCGLEDTLAYYSRAQLEDGFKKTCAFQPRVIKQNRGSAGEGIWLCWLADGDRQPVNVSRYPATSFGAKKLDDNDMLKLMEMNDNHVEYHTVHEFLAFCVDGPGGAAGTWQSTFPGKYLEGGKEAGGQLVDQRLLPRIDEGEVRLLMAGDTCQMIIHKKPTAGGLSAVGGNSEYTYYTPADAKYAGLLARLYADIPTLLDALELSGEPLPLLWTADFIPKDADGGSAGSAATEYVVGEFNCSCVGISKFQAVCGGDKTLADVSDEDYYDACELTDLMGVKAIEMLSSNKATSGRDGDVAALLGSVLENSKGEPVAPNSALAGKVVALFFAAQWCPSCRRFTPLLRTLYDQVNEEGRELEVIFVSSDKSAEEQVQFTEEAHGDWLRVAYGSDVRAALKRRFGCFAAMEAGEFPEVERRAGIPSLVIIGPHLEELRHYDCDNGGAGLQLITAKGGATMDDWKTCAWPVAQDARASVAAASALPTGLEGEVITWHTLESEWTGLEDDVDSLRTALLDKIAAARGPALEWARLRRGCARLLGWLNTNESVLTSDSLPGAAADSGGDEGDGPPGGSTPSPCEPDCDTLALLSAAQLCESELNMRAVEADGLKQIVATLRAEPEYAQRAADLFAAVGPRIDAAVPHMRKRIGALQRHSEMLTRRRAERLAFGQRVATFEATVECALELISFPVATIDTADQLAALLAEGDRQAETLVLPPDGAQSEARAEAAELLASWREVSPALSLRAAECEGAHRAAMDEARLLAECASLTESFRRWERRTGGLLMPDASVKAVDATGVRVAAELAAAQVPVGEALLERAARLRARLKSAPAEAAAPAGTTRASMPPHAEMVSAIAHVRNVAERLSRAAAIAPPRFDPTMLNAALGAAGAAGMSHQALPEALSRFTSGGSEGELNPFPLDSNPPAAKELPADAVDGHEFSRTVLEHVNFVRTQPAEAAAELRIRLGGCFQGHELTPPWQAAGEKPIATTEGIGALDDLVHRLEQTPPLPALQHMDELHVAASALGGELASGKERAKASSIEARLSGLGTWSGVAGEAVMYGMRKPEAIVTMLLLCDGDPSRRNRSFALNPDVSMAAFSSTEISSPDGTMWRTSTNSQRGGPIGVLSFLSHFYPALNEARTVEFQGPVEKRRRPMPKAMSEVLAAIPSDEACDVVLAALQKGKHVKLEYKVTSVVITVTDRSGARKVSRLNWT